MHFGGLVVLLKGVQPTVDLQASRGQSSDLSFLAFVVPPDVILIEAVQVWEARADSA